ncbi:hypothetical protein J3459_010612 [Metarhizium acridum]|nr:hypothetical protein J3459_010612 [Metarhizium acridum]
MSALSPPKSSFEMDDDIPPRLAAEKIEPPLKKTLHTAVLWIFISNLTILFNKWLIDTQGFRFRKFGARAEAP